MNVRDDLQEVKMSFDVKTGRSYTMHLDLDAEGMLTDIRICDSKGNVIYQNLSEWFKLSTMLDLEAGNYLFTLTFIRNPEVMVQYLEEKKYVISQEQLDLLTEVFAKSHDDEFIPVSFSAVIQ